VKKRILITTIFISVAALVLAGYFVGCGQREKATSQEARESAKKPDLKEEAKLSLEVTELPEVATKRSVKVAETQAEEKLHYIHPAKPQVTNGFVSKKIREPSALMGEDAIVYLRDDTKSGLERRSNALRLGVAGEMRKKSRYGVPATPSSMAGYDYMDSVRGLGGVKQIPAELLNVTEDEIWAVSYTHLTLPTKA